MRSERAAFTASLVGFWLDIGSELVFVGDAGATEPSAASRRLGTELALFWRPARWLMLDGSLAATHARYRDGAGPNRFIPGATPLVVGAGANLRLSERLSATLRLRHFGSAPLIEDNSQRSRSTTVLNFGAYWDCGGWRISADLLNLLDSRDPDVSYWYASRLPGEPAAGVEDRHSHPVEPRQLRVAVRLRF